MSTDDLTISRDDAVLLHTALGDAWARVSQSADRLEMQSIRPDLVRELRLREGQYMRLASLLAKKLEVKPGGDPCE